MPLKILKVCTSRAWGGMEMSMVETSVHLRARGHAVIPVCAPETAIEERLRAEGFVPFLADLWGKVHLGQALRLRTLIRSRQVDLVHCDWSRDLFTLVPALCITPRVSLVLHKHIGVMRPKRLVVHHGIYRRVDHVIAISEVIRHNFRAMHPIAPEKVSVIHHGIDLERFRPDPARRARIRRELGADPACLLVGIVGRITQSKGHEEFLQTARVLVAEDPRVRFVVVGAPTRGEESEGEAILARIIEYGLEDRVVVTGYRSDVPDVLGALDVFTFPSYAEGFGLALVEAMAMGLATVSSNCDGVVDIAVDQQTGLMVPPRDAGALAGGVRHLLGDAGLRARMGRAGRERVERLFSVERMFDRLETLYDRLVAERAAGKPGMLANSS